MVNFEVYQKVMKSQGVETSHTSNRVPTINDHLVDGDILTIPHHVTFFTMNNVEFIVFPNEEGELKRLYIGWLDRGTGSMRDSLAEYPNYESFFAENEGRKFKVRITEGEPVKDPFGMEHPTKKYLFKWCK